MPMLTTRPDGLRKIPSPEWLRVFIGPTEEVVYKTAGMKPPYYAPIGQEVPPAHRLPLWRRRFFAAVQQGRNQQTAFPSPILALLSPRRAVVQPPFQVAPVELEYPMSPSGVKMTW